MTNDFRQAAWEAIVAVIKQGEPSGELRKNSEGEESFACFYRDSCGNKCLVGFMISDENYDPELEELNANNPEVLAALPFKATTYDSYEARILFGLQKCHDEAALVFHNNHRLFLEQFKDNLEEFVGTKGGVDWILDYKKLLTDENQSV